MSADLFAGMDEDELFDFEEDTGLDHADRGPWGPEDYARASAWLRERAAELMGTLEAMQS